MVDIEARNITVMDARLAMLAEEYRDFNSSNNADRTPGGKAKNDQSAI